jgi:soluble lytic murein transglycosylase
MKFGLISIAIFYSITASANSAKNLVKLYTAASNMELKSHILRRAEKSVDSGVYEDYKPWIETISKIHKTHDPIKLFEMCNNFVKKNFLVNNSRTYCYKKFFYNSSRRRVDISKFPILKTNLLSLDRKSLTQIRKYSLRRRSLYVWLKSLISTEYIDANRTPSTRTLKKFPSKEIRKHAQNKISSAKLNRKSYLIFKKKINLCRDSKSDRMNCTREILNAYSPNIGKSKKSLFIFAKDLTQDGFYDESREVMGYLVKKSPKNEEYLFSYLWNFIEEKKYKNAYRFLSLQNNLHRNYKKINSSKLRYWIAFTLKELNDSKSKDIFKSILKDSTVSFYSIAASKILKLNKKRSRSLANTKEGILYSNKPINKNISNMNQRINEFEEIKASKFTQFEISNIFKLKSRSEISNASYLISRTLNKKKYYLDSFRILHVSIEKDYLEPNSQVLDLLFPLAYKSNVTKKNKEIDPLLSLSLIRQESGFNHYAKSSVGARGLMQLMYKTAKRFKTKLKKRDLYKPNLNIRLGTKYLEKLHKKYDKNLVYTLAAYNAGESRVKRWKKNLFNDDSILHNIERIPYKETRKYVKLIFRNLFFYKAIYQNKIDSSDMNTIFDIKLGYSKLAKH